jgi:hypothetical protein
MMWLHRLYSVIILVIGCFCLLIASYLVEYEQALEFGGWQHALVFLLLGLALSSMTSRLPGPGRRYAMSFFAPMLLIGPALATFLGAAASLIQVLIVAARDVYVSFRTSAGRSAPDTRDQRNFLKENVNSLSPHLSGIVQAAIAIMFSGRIYLCLGGTTGHISVPDDIVPVCAAAGSLFFAEIILGESAAALKYNRPLLASWRNGLFYSFPVAAAIAGLELLLVLLYQRPEMRKIDFSLLIVLIPCWLLYYSFRLYLEMRHAFERTLHTLAVDDSACRVLGRKRASWDVSQPPLQSRWDCRRAMSSKFALQRICWILGRWASLESCWWAIVSSARASAKPTCAMPLLRIKFWSRSSFCVRSGA